MPEHLRDSPKGNCSDLTSSTPLAATYGPLNIAKNRTDPKWTQRELFGRALWELCRGPLFAWTPRQMWGWRCALLRLFGAKIGRAVHILPSVRITVPWNLLIEDEAAVGDRAILYSLGPIHIGARATISQHAHLCAGTHDFNKHDMPLIKSHIEIGEDVWICADAFVGPGVGIGAGAVLGARGVAMKNLSAETVYAGNPAREIGPRRRTPGDRRDTQ